MPFEYDLKSDIHYQQGRAEGRAKSQKRIIKRMLKDNWTFKQIAEILDISEEDVRTQYNGNDLRSTWEDKEIY